MNEGLAELLWLLEQEGAEVFFEEEEGWDWAVHSRHLKSDTYFPRPQEAIVDMVKKLIANEPPIPTGVRSEYDQY